jgi:Domain of unknown function (DUF4407)
MRSSFYVERHQMEHKKHDLTGRSHDQPREGKPFAVILAAWFSVIADLLIIYGGGHPQTVRQVSSARETLDFMILGLVLLGTMLMTASTVTTVLHFAADDGRFHILYALVGILVGAMQGASDNILQYRKPLLERGLAELRRIGMRLPDVVQRPMVALMLLLQRILQGAGIGSLAGLCLILLAMHTSIDSFGTRKFMTDNPAVSIEMTKLVDSAITRSTDERNGATGRIDQLNRMLATLRQENVRRAVRAGSRAASTSAMAPDAQIAALETNLAAETSRRDVLSAKLDQQLVDRNGEIERRILSSPNVVPKLSGLSGQIEALTALTKSDPKILVFIIIFQLVSLALELSPMWISLSDRFFPCTYAAHLAMESFNEVTQIGRDGARRLGLLPPEEEAPAAPPTQESVPTPANDDLPVAPSSLNGATPLRRGRGRPPGKNGVDRTSKETGHD